MPGRQAALVATLSVILAACGAAAQPTASMLVSPDPSHGPSPLARVTPSPTLVATTTTATTPEPTPEPTPKPSPRATTVPVPPKPSGLGYDRPSELEGGGVARLSWKAPRTEGVEIRVYGVTRCLPGDEGLCLQKSTALPDDIRVLLAKAPASKGKVTWNQAWGLEPVPIEDDPDWACTTAFVSENGTPFYSIVVAAYSTSGHSIFAIVDPGWLGEADVCPG